MFPLYDNIPHRRAAWVSYALIAINIYALFWLRQQAPDMQQQVVLNRGFVPARLEQLRDKQPIEISLQQLAQHPHLPVQFQVQRKYELPADPTQIFASLITAMFLHGSWPHLIGNMWFLFIFADNIEDRLGHVPFLLFYLAGGIVASMCHWWIEPASRVPVVGASGAVSAVLGAYAVTFPRAEVRTLLFLGIFVTFIDVSAWVFLGGWFAIQLLEGSQAVRIGINGGVAWWAHVGGFVAGAVLMPLLDRRRGTPAVDEPEPVDHEPRAYDPADPNW